MAYIVGADRYQTRMVTTSLDDLISKDNSVRVIDSYVETLDLENLGLATMISADFCAFSIALCNGYLFQGVPHRPP